MAIYTISLNFFDNLTDKDGICLGSILFRFSNHTTPYKIAVDRNEVIFQKYKEIKMFKDTIRTWLELLSYVSTKIVRSNVDLSEIKDREMISIALCAATNGEKKMIVYSLDEDILKFKINNQNQISYNNEQIEVVDKETAEDLLNRNNIKIENSVVTMNGGNIINSSNIINNG